MLFSFKKDLIKYLDQVKKRNFTVGFIPTMGALHEGHLSLVRKAATQNDILLVSIFVNPTQFDNKEDLEKYPRNHTSDHELLKKHFNNNELVIYAPEVHDIYLSDPKSKRYDYGGIEFEMEGANRPGHFDGVGTILEFLFTLINPDRAYFGEKDFQQLQIVKSLVETLELPIEIIGCPIERETNGLARSSRNERLSAKARIKAAKIYQSLLLAQEIFQSQKPQRVFQIIKDIYAREEELALEYFTIANENSLKEVTSIKPGDKNLRAFIVVHIEGVRLIDNLKLN